MHLIKKVPFVVSIVACAMLITTLYSCSPDESDPVKGEVEFSVDEQDVPSGSTPDAMVVTIEDDDGNVVYDQEKLDLSQSSGEYVSDALSLDPGDYTLTEFVIVDEDDVVIVYTPEEGSDLAHLVGDPAPIDFTITADDVTNVSPEVVNENADPLSIGLVAWYPFNGNAQDESGNGNHGVVTSASLTSDKDGGANSAYLFNGTAYIRIPSEDLVLQEFTYSMWVNSTTALPSGFSGNMFSVGDQNTSHHQCLTIANQYASTLATGWFVGGWNQSPTGPVVANVGTNSLPAVNQWAHIVWVRSQSSTTMYFNNQLIGTVTTNDYPAFYGTSVIANIGMRCNNTQGFIGKIDNFRIYNRTLSASEVAALYNE